MGEFCVWKSEIRVGKRRNENLGERESASEIPAKEANRNQIRLGKRFGKFLEIATLERGFLGQDNSPCSMGNYGNSRMKSPPGNLRFNVTPATSAIR
jgi:hypothetical protein